MTISLHDRLTELAGDAPPGGAAPGLWDRARRSHRRRRIGTIAIVVLVLIGLGAIGTLDWARSRQPPAPADSAPALPERIWMPSGWLAGTDEVGPLGQLAALQPTTRLTWTGEREGVVGISARTGEYAFVDLPDAVIEGYGVALAPDGRHVAYWYKGETQGSPNSDHGPIVGLAVYDTATEEVIRRQIPTDHGIHPTEMTWADSERLVYGYDHWAGGDDQDEVLQMSGTDGGGLRVWTPSTGLDERLPAELRGSRVNGSTGRGQLLLEGGPSGGAVFLDLDRPDNAITFRMPGNGYSHTAAVNETGTRVAWPRGNRNPGPIVFGTPEPGRPVDAKEVDTRRAWVVRAWLDETHVAAAQRIDDRIGPSVLRAIDVRTGESSVILRYPDGTYGTTTLLATDLLGTPSVSRDAPPRPLDPRWVTAAEAAVLILGVGALLLWRRRRVRV